MIETLFGEVLKEERKQQKISQEKLAELADLDRTYISLLERGLRQPSLQTLFKIAEALGLQASHLVLKVEEKNGDQ